MSPTLQKSFSTAWMQYSNDWNPLHYDVTYAASSGHQNTIVHGILPYLEGFNRMIGSGNWPMAEPLTIIGKFQRPLPHDQDLQWHTDDRGLFKILRLMSSEQTYVTLRANHHESPGFELQPGEETIQVIPLEEVWQKMERSVHYVGQDWLNLTRGVAAVFTLTVRQALPLYYQLPPHLRSLGLSGREVGDLLHIQQKVSIATSIHLTEAAQGFLILTRIRAEASYLGEVQSYFARVIQGDSIKAFIQSDFIKLEKSHDKLNNIFVS